MFLSRIIIQDFKNISSADISLSEKMNCICGNNGEGKTNFIDAVYYLSMTKSFLSSVDRYTYTIGKDRAVLHGTYLSDSEQEDIAISVSGNGEKAVRRNGKAYRRISDHVGHIPVVVVSPTDVTLVLDSGEERRRFLNMMLSQIDSRYLGAVMSYNKALRQRNFILKQENFQQILLDTVSEQMVPYAECIFKARRDILELLDERTRAFYEVISDGREQVSLTYRSDMNDGSISDLWNSCSSRDRAAGYTTQGVHRDDVEFEMDGMPLKKCASQGQQKSFLISMKLAQYSIMKEIYKVEPILLLDDLFDKLDANRVASLVKMVIKEDFGQIFITDTDRERLADIVGNFTDRSKFFSVSDGVVSEI